MKVLLLGTGFMGKAYAQVLNKLEVEFEAIGRSPENSEAFSKDYNVKTLSGGVKENIEYIRSNDFSHAIIAINETEVRGALEVLSNLNISEFLVEKPGAISTHSFRELQKSLPSDKKYFLAYNRRFYSSVDKLIELANKDGGVQSIFFEFTEWSDKISVLDRNEEDFNNWLFLNSTHVLDTAFFIAGKPSEISSYSSGSLAWHKKASNFSGAGVTENGVLFSYMADWDGPGRWGIEALTKNYRFYLKPMEKLQIQKRNSVSVEYYEVDDSLDITFKPGIFNQTKAFLNGTHDKLITFKEQAEMTKIYDTVLLGSA